MQWNERVGRRLKLRDLHILLAVIELGSMGKAAARLAMSQPAVSKAIADLEYALGVRVLDRSRRGIEPTIYGRALLKCGSAVFDDLRQGVKDIEFLNDPTRGEVRLGTSDPTASGIVSAVIEKLSRQHPRLVFDVVIEGSARLYRQLVDRNVEFVIGRVVDSDTDENIKTEILYDDGLVIVAGAQSKWVRRRRIDLAELIDEPWVLAPSDALVSTLFAEACRASKVRSPQGTVITLSQNLSNILLATGRFLAVRPASMLKFANTQSIRPLPVKLRAGRRPIALKTLKNRTLSPVAQLFIACAHTLAQQEK